MNEDFNIEKHILVPKHSLLSEEDAKKVLAHYNISSNQLPRISRNDPAIKPFGAKQNNIIKIVRKTETAG